MRGASKGSSDDEHTNAMEQSALASPGSQPQPERSERAARRQQTAMRFEKLSKQANSQAHSNGAAIPHLPQREVLREQGANVDAFHHGPFVLPVLGSGLGSNRGLRTGMGRRTTALKQSTQ